MTADMPAAATVPAKTKTSAGRKLLLTGLVILIIGAAATIFGSGKSSTSTPALNADTLATSVQDTANTKLKSTGAAVTVTSVLCVEGASRNFVCQMTMSDGSSRPEKVLVAADGQSWVTNN